MFFTKGYEDTVQSIVKVIVVLDLDLALIEPFHIPKNYFIKYYPPSDSLNFDGIWTLCWVLNNIYFMYFFNSNTFFKILLTRCGIWTC